MALAGHLVEFSKELGGVPSCRGEETDEQLIGFDMTDKRGAGAPAA